MRKLNKLDAADRRNILLRPLDEGIGAGREVIEAVTDTCAEHHRIVPDQQRRPTHPLHNCFERRGCRRRLERAGTSRRGRHARCPHPFEQPVVDLPLDRRSETR